MKVGSRERPPVMLITDPAWSLSRIEDVIARAAAALGRGGLGVQLRDKRAPIIELVASVRRLRATCTRAGAFLILNATTPSATEAIHVARDEGVDGVHVASRFDMVDEAKIVLGGRAWISTPSHADDDVVFALAHDAAATLVSPIFPTPGKGPPRGVAAIARARARATERSPLSSLALYALGGVDATNAAACAEAGADGVAVIRALLDAPDPAAVARALAEPFRRV